MGYWLDDQLHEGFNDDPNLPTPLRRRIAGWAKALTPGALSAAQVDLLNTTPEKPRSEAREQAERAGSYEASPFWGRLTAHQRNLVRDPSSHRELPVGTTYPLKIGQFATLVGAKDGQVRHWTNAKLIPAGRAPNGYRLYYQDAAVRAFAFQSDFGQAEVAFLKKLESLEPSVLAGLAMVFHDMAGTAADNDLTQVFARLSEDIDQIGFHVAHGNLEEIRSPRELSDVG